MSEAGREPSRAVALPFDFVVAIVSGYLVEAQGDPMAALKQAIQDALADQLKMERRTRCAERLVSRGFVRGQAARYDRA